MIVITLFTLLTVVTKLLIFVITRLFRILIVMLLGMAFVSQAFALTMMPYHMLSMKVVNYQEQLDEIRLIERSNNTVTESSSLAELMPSDLMQNCCEQNCQCLGSCYFTLVMFSNTITNNLTIKPSNKILSIAYHLPSEIISSLYKPPILS